MVLMRIPTNAFLDPVTKAINPTIHGVEVERINTIRKRKIYI